MSQSKAPSQRQRRVGELVRKGLSELLSRGMLPDDELQEAIITVPQVRMTPDLKLAIAYIMPLGGERAQEILQALRRQTKFIRGQLAPRLALKYMPALRFELDTTFEAAQRMDALLNSPQVARDLGKRNRTDSL